MPNQLEMAFVINFIVGNLIALITVHPLQLYFEEVIFLHERIAFSRCSVYLGFFCKSQVFNGITGWPR